MLGEWKSAVAKGNLFGALFTDFSKTFDCLSHNLWLTKRHAYLVGIAALQLIHSYLTKQKAENKIKLIIQSLEGHLVWCTTRSHYRTFTV